tara:strand:+ start:1010 stop:1168 length:159 start_codon:yes stop_codon:yes gene_type:complete
VEGVETLPLLALVVPVGVVMVEVMQVQEQLTLEAVVVALDMLLQVALAVQAS